MGDDHEPSALRRYQGAHYDSARWDGFAFRDDDIVICTPQKCGTTWMQMICALLIFQTDQLPARLGELSPWLDSKVETVADVAGALAVQQHRRFIKTHTPLDGVPYRDSVSFLCVGRDPRDVAISNFHSSANVNHQVARAAIHATGGFEGLPEEWWTGPPAVIDDVATFFWGFVYMSPPAANPVGGLAGVTAHLGGSWSRRQLPNITLVHYQDLESNLEAEMHRIAEVLGISVSESLWPELVGAARFESMQARADELVPEVRIDGLWRDNRRFFNRGASGQWREFVSAVDQRSYEARLDELGIEAEFRQWLHNGFGPRALHIQARK